VIRFRKRLAATAVLLASIFAGGVASQVAEASLYHTYYTGWIPQSYAAGSATGTYDGMGMYSCSSGTWYKRSAARSGQHVLHSWSTWSCDSTAFGHTDAGIYIQCWTTTSGSWWASCRYRH
jgi:hypothetical protein